MVASSGRSPHSAWSCRLPCSFPSSEHALRAAGSSAVLLVFFFSTDHICVVSCECCHESRQRTIRAAKELEYTTQSGGSAPEIAPVVQF